MLISLFKKNKRSLSMFLTVVMITIILMNVFSILTKAAIPGGIIEDGIYALKNKATGYYLDIQNDSVETGKYIQQYDYGAAPLSENTRSGLFKFVHRGSDGYLIRTMRNNLNTFCRINDLEVKTTAANPIDSENPSSLNWYLNDAGDGYYYLQAAYYLKCLCTPAENVNNDKYCTTELYTTAGDRAKWELIKYTGPAMNGIDVRFSEPQIVDMGSTINITSDKLYTKYFYTSDLYVNYRGAITGYILKSPSGDTSNIAYMSGNNLVGNYDKVGMVSLSVVFSNATSNPFNIYFKPTIGEYFLIQNIKTTLGFVKATSYGNCTKTTFNYDDKQIWKRTYVGMGYYYIQNMNGMYLTAPNTSSSGSNITLNSSLLSGTAIDRQRWRFDTAPSDSGGTRIQSASMGNLWIKINPYNYLIQDTYINNNVYDDEFNIIMLGDYVIYHRTLEGFQSVDVSNIIKNIYGHYNGFELVHLNNHLGNNENSNNSNACFNLAKTMIEDSYISILSGHGSPTVITISDTNQQHYLRNNHIYSSSTPSNYLSSVDIIIFAGCSTAGTAPSGSYNLPKSAELAGSSVAIGWSVTQYGNRMHYWMETFFNYMNTIDTDTGDYYTASKALYKTNLQYSTEVNQSLIYGKNTSFNFY